MQESIEQKNGRVGTYEGTKMNTQEEEDLFFIKFTGANTVTDGRKRVQMAIQLWLSQYVDEEEEGDGE